MKTKDEQAIRDLYATWRRATMAEDLPTILNLIADDAVFLVPGQPPILGKEQFAELFELVRGKYRIETRSEFDEISVHDGWAHVRCRLAVVLTPKAGGAPEFNAGHVLSILKKRSDGAWVVARDANLLAPETHAGTRSAGSSM
jgi:uncharacterized protein (TIGR02246 family)